MAIIGRMHISPSLGSSACVKPILSTFNPREPANWKAVCGKTARTVWSGLEGGEPIYPASLPLSMRIGIAIQNTRKNLYENIAKRKSRGLMMVR